MDGIVDLIFMPNSRSHRPLDTSGSETEGFQFCCVKLACICLKCCRLARIVHRFHNCLNCLIILRVPESPSGCSTTEHKEIARPFRDYYRFERLEDSVSMVGARSTRESSALTGDWLFVNSLTRFSAD